jgi:UDP-2-acetamido-2,6-beta-L-arabino-hexul-4-ose reductase
VIVYANSIQSGTNSAFGRTKEAAADHLMTWGRKTGSAVADVRLPNVFGEHGRPNYNSVVATFCHTLARGETPTIVVDRELLLLHAQDAVDTMIDRIDQKASGVFHPEGCPMTVSAILQKLTSFRDLYRAGDIPDTSERIERALFNTYRSFCFPNLYPIYPVLRSDGRGDLFEGVRGHGGTSQVFSSTTHPGITRGNHFHRRKVERFIVVKGSATISLRRLFHDQVVHFQVSGERPALVDMPTMWAHSITNTGGEELTTLFWTDEIFDPTRPDTYAEPVDPQSAAS